MAKICTVAMTEGSLRMLVGILKILRDQMAREGRLDLSGAIDGLLTTLAPHDITPLEA